MSRLWLSRMSTIPCMAFDTGLFVANESVPKRASKMGRVMRCWDSIEMASSSVMLSLRLARNPWRNRSNSSPTPVSISRMACMRAAPQHSVTL